MFGGFLGFGVNEFGVSEKNDVFGSNVSGWRERGRKVSEGEMQRKKKR